MKKPLGFVASLMLVLILSGSAYGWSDGGHMAVAFVAYQNLSPSARARVDTLVRLNPRFEQWSKSIPVGTSSAKKRLFLFMIAATWADQIKSSDAYLADGTEGGNIPPSDGTAARITDYSDRAMHKYWHFVDLPFSPDGTPLEDPLLPNAATQIPLLRAVLGSSDADSRKSYALVWLLHLIGDVHQPLHGISRFTSSQPKGDAGGNTVFVCDPQCGTRLHQFWDGLLGTSDNPANAVTLAQSFPPVLNAPVGNLNTAPVGNLNTKAWIDESFEIAKSKVYRSPIGIGRGPFTVTSAYRTASLSLAKQRAALAGMRLARILNTELK